MAGNHQTNLLMDRNDKNIRNNYNFLESVCLAENVRTWVGTYEDPCPCRDSTTGMQLMRFRKRCQSWGPSFACLDERWSFVVFYKRLSRPTGRQRSTRRRQCDRCIRGSCDRGRSERKFNALRKCAKLWVVKSLLTHSWPYESVKSLTAFESQVSRMPNNFSGKNPFSAMMTKYTKKPAAAWIIPICPYAMEINLFFL